MNTFHKVISRLLLTSAFSLQTSLATETYTGLSGGGGGGGGMQSLEEREESTIVEGVRAYRNSVPELKTMQASLKDLIRHNTEVIGRSGTIFIGKTGAGKSTLINLLNFTMNIKGTELIAENPADRAKMLEASNRTTSCTSHAQSLQSDDFGLLIDLPGFEDTRGVNSDIINALILKDVLTKLRDVRIILISDANSAGGRAEGLAKELERYTKILPQTVLENSFCIVINKMSPEQANPIPFKQFLADKGLMEIGIVKELFGKKRVFGIPTAWGEGTTAEDSDQEDDSSRPKSQPIARDFDNFMLRVHDSVRFKEQKRKRFLVPKEIKKDDVKILSALNQERINKLISYINGTFLVEAQAIHNQHKLDFEAALRDAVEKDRNLLTFTNTSKESFLKAVRDRLENNAEYKFFRDNLGAKFVNDLFESSARTGEPSLNKVFELIRANEEKAKKGPIEAGFEKRIREAKDPKVRKKLEDEFKDYKRSLLEMEAKVNVMNQPGYWRRDMSGFGSFVFGVFNVATLGIVGAVADHMNKNNLSVSDLSEYSSLKTKTKETLIGKK